MGTTGPRDINPATGRPYGLSFPVITIADMVRAQKLLLDHLGIDTALLRDRRLDGRHAGAAMGGRLSRARLRRRADRRRRAPFGAEHRLPRGRPPGDHGRSRLVRRRLSGARAATPRRGLAVARMAAHITYLSETALHRKFGRKLQDRDRVTYGFDADFQVESYLRHQGSSFVDRFDANSYLYITRAMDYFDLAAEHGGVLANAFRGTPVRFCLISFTSDWLFPTAESRADRARAERGRRQCQLRRDRDRQGPRRLPARRAGIRRDACAASSIGCAEHRGLTRERGTGKLAPAWDADRLRSPARPPAGIAIRVDLQHHRRHGGRRARRVLDVGCGDGALLDYLVHFKQVDGRGIELGQAGVNACVGRGLASSRATPTPISRTIPPSAFDYVDPVARPCRRRAIPAACCASSCASAGGRSSPFPISAIGGCAGICWREGRMPVTARAARRLVRDAQHPSLHDPRFRRAVPRATGSPSSAALVIDAGRDGPSRSDRISLPICSASTECSCCGGRERVARQSLPARRAPAI